MARVLIIAYGNPLRSDDGIGWLVAGELRSRLASPEVSVLQLHQLLPEVAEAVSRADSVIFVDASRDGEPGELRCQPVTAPSMKASFSHQLSPAEVVALAQELYGTSPQAFSVSLVGQCFEHGEGLSSSVTARLPHLAAKVEGLTKQILSGGPVSLAEVKA